MAVFELYSKRRARELGNVPDVYEYDKIPEALKVQIIHIWSDAIGIPYVTTHRDSSISNIRSTYHAIAQVLRREYGLFKLVPNSDPDEKAHSQDELKNWFLRETNADRILDAVELSARFIERACSRTDYIPTRQNKEICKQAIEELNKRFQENGVGYQYMDGIIVRVDFAAYSCRGGQTCSRRAESTRIQERSRRIPKRLRTLPARQEGRGARRLRQVLREYDENYLYEAQLAVRSKPGHGQAPRSNLFGQRSNPVLLAVAF